MTLTPLEIEIDRAVALKQVARRETGTRFSIVSVQMRLTYIGNPLNSIPDRRATKIKRKRKKRN